MFASLARFVRSLLGTYEEPYRPVRQEMLVRSQSFKLHYTKWLGQKRHEEFLKNLYTSFTLNKLGIAGDIPLHYYQEPYSSHLLIHYIDKMGKDLLPFLQDYFRDRAMRLGYSLYLSDRKTLERLGYVEKTERHILRPGVSMFPGVGKQEQLYGVIELLLLYIDERPLYLSITAEASLDEGFSPCFPFDELAEILFT